MIILDTNVLSELLRPQPEQAVADWISRQRSSAVFTTSVTEAEIRYGVERLPTGQRKEALHRAITGIFQEDFLGRILPFDSDAAIAYAEIVTSRDQAGRPISQFDAQIAAIAGSRGAELATRNERDFLGCGLRLYNPWSRKSST